MTELPPLALLMLKDTRKTPHTFAFEIIERMPLLKKLLKKVMEYPVTSRQ